MFLLLVLTTVVLLGSGWAGVPLDEFYPYGNGNVDTFLRIYQIGGRIQLRTPFPFFNDTYGVVYVTNNGIIFFREDFDWFMPKNCRAVGREDAYIAPYFADVYTHHGGNVSYRESRDRQVLEKAERDIRAGFPTSSSPSLVSALVVTWDGVPFDGASHCSDAAKEMRNTFQAVLTTDGSRSWAIFYYNELSWTHHGWWTTANIFNCSGLGGNDPAWAGYDAGDKQNFQFLPGSCTNDVLKLAHTSNMGYDGKWILRVAGPLISCIRANSDKLTISPTSVSQGSKSILRLSSPCLKDSELTNITCELLDSPPVNATFWVDRDSPTVFCLLPDLLSSGQLQVNLRVSDHLFTGYVEVTPQECPPILNGQVKVLGDRRSSLARLSCNPGYVLVGTKDLICGYSAEGNLTWLGPIPTCYPLPPPTHGAVICNDNANECLQPDFPDGSCVTYVMQGCWVQLYCDEWTPSPRIRRQEVQETIIWKKDGALMVSGQALGTAPFGNMTLTHTGTYECQKVYKSAYSTSGPIFRSPPTIHRIQVVPVPK